MPLVQAATTVDCADVAAVSSFWAAALGRPVEGEPGNPYFARIPATGPGEVAWLFVAVPEPKTVKNRMHVDFTSTDRTTEVARLMALGAVMIGEYDEWGVRWTILRDVEGNEFCVADPQGHA